MKLFILIILILYFPIFPSVAQKELYDLENDGYYTDLIKTDLGIISTNNRDNAIYLIREGTIETLYENPGCGRFISIHKDLIGFKYIDTETGLQSPAVFNVLTGQVSELDKRTRNCGQVSFSDDGTIAFTVNHDLIILDPDGSRKAIYLGDYSNLSVISPDSRFVAYNGKGQSCSLFNLKTFEKKQINNNLEFISFKWSSDSNKLAFISISGDLFIYDVEKDQCKEYEKVKNFTWGNSTELFVTKTRHNEKELTASDIYLIDTETDITTQVTYSPDIFEMYPFYKNGILYYNSFNQREIVSGKISKSKLLNKKIFYKHDRPLNLKPVRINDQSLSKNMLNVPYINQVYDTDGYGHRYGCCAATSCSMVLAYYKLIPHWQTSNNNWAHFIFDNYIFRNFNYDARYWSDTYLTYYGTGGGDGYMWNDNGNGGASPSWNQRYYLQQHGLSSSQLWTNFWTPVSTDLNNGNMHPMCVMLTASGHLIDPIGIADGTNQLLYYNDPYGNMNIAYPSTEGAGVLYDWPGFNTGHVNLDMVAWTTSAVGNMPDENDLDIEESQLSYTSDYDDFDEQNNGFWMLADGTTGMKYWRHVDTGLETYWWTGAMTGISVDDYCASWNPDISTPGFYSIKAFIPSETELVTNAKYQIYHNSSVDLVTGDQSAASGSYIDLGTFYFSGSPEERVYLGDATGSQDVKKEHSEKEKVLKIVYDRMEFTPVVPGFTATNDWYYGTDDIAGSVSGGFIWGTVMNANHTDNTNSELIFDISDSNLPGNSILSFDHWYQLEASSSSSTAFDGGNIKISLNGGNDWDILNPVPDYSHIISTSYTNPMPGQPAYSGDSEGWKKAIIDLAAYEGDNILLKWQFGSDTNINERGWYIDNISVIQLLAPENINIDISGNSVSLFWDEVDAADSYKIYSSSDPYADQAAWIYVTEVYTNSHIITDQTEKKKFYMVLAVLSAGRQ